MNISTTRLWRGTQKDSETIVAMTRAMLIEMAMYGGDSINISGEVWEWFSDEVRRNCTRTDHFHIFSVDIFSHEITGFLSANLEIPEILFSGRSKLHISAVYIIPSKRNQGLATNLIQQALAWGYEMGVNEVKLNVLATNPARRLYEKLGFQEREIQLSKSLIQKYP